MNLLLLLERQASCTDWLKLRPALSECPSVSLVTEGYTTPTLMQGQPQLSKHSHNARWSFREKVTLYEKIQKFIGVAGGALFEFATQDTQRHSANLPLSHSKTLRAL